MENEKNIILQAKGLSKHFGGVCALDNVDIELYRGEVLGIVGDNGAGKSTLIKIISGVYKKDKGEIYLDGEKVEINSPGDAKLLGIETVYQDLALVDEFDVPANIFLGREIVYKNFLGKLLRFLNNKKMYEESKNLMDNLNINLGNLSREILYYSGGQRQAVSLSKILYWGKKIAILDEPTAALGVREGQKALELVRTLKEHGLSIIIISHNLQHVFSIVDRIMVLRRGKRVGVKNSHEVSANDIVSMITGAEVIEKV